MTVSGKGQVRDTEAGKDRKMNKGRKRTAEEERNQDVNLLLALIIPPLFRKDSLLKRGCY